MKLFWILALLFLQSSCAYHFGTLKRTLPGGYTKVAVPIFKNSSSEPGIETYFTSAMIEELERHDMADVTGEDDAQVVLEGTIQSIRYERGAYFSPEPNTALNTEYYINVNTEVKLIRKSDQKLLWSNVFSGRRQYYAPQITINGLKSANALYNHSARLRNLGTIAKEMMEQAHNHMTENF
jgi:hypothetical protein